MLRLEDVCAGYGTVEVLHHVSLEVDAGEMVVLLGANGAGKSTLLRSISGLVAVRDGAKYWEKQNINGLPAHRVVKLGISQVPEGRHVFAPLTVMENLIAGASLEYGRDRKGVYRNFEAVFGLFPVLHQRRQQKAGTLSGGEQQMLAIGRALMNSPKLLMLDEPSLGLAPKVVETIYEVLRKLNQEGMTVLLVEQNAAMALDLANRGYVIDAGRVVLSGPADYLRTDRSIQDIYLGGEVHAS